jgi:hypothetical protein
MESDQIKISQKFDHSSAPNIRIRSAQPRIGNFNRDGQRGFQHVISRFSSKASMLPTNPQMTKSGIRRFSNEIARFTRPTNAEKIVAVINKQEQFKREQQVKENLPPNYIKNFFDMCDY